MIYVCSLSAVESNVARLAPSHLVSLLDPAGMIDTPAGFDPRRHHKVGVNDIAAPVPGHVSPEEGHVAALIAFLRDWPGEAPLLIHCWAGVSRSTASAYIAACLWNEGREFEVALSLRDRAPHASPNKRIVHLADRLLSREGRMIAGLAAMGPADFVAEGPTFNLPHRLDD